METMITEEQANKLLKEKITKLINEKWNWTNDDYGVYVQERYHRSKIKEIANIDMMKDKILLSLGYIPVFFFLKNYGSLKSNPGPFRTSEKGKLSFTK
jgi:hypothetical protein